MIKMFLKLFKGKPRFIINVNRKKLLAGTEYVYGEQFVVEEFLEARRDRFGRHYDAGYTGAHLFENWFDSEEEARSYIQRILDKEREDKLNLAYKRIIEVYEE